MVRYYSRSELYTQDFPAPDCGDNREGRVVVGEAAELVLRTATWALRRR